MKRLRKSEIKELSSGLPIDLDKKDDVLQSDTLLKINGTLAFFKHEDQWIPALTLILQQPNLLPRVTVDMGAIKFVTRGADIMRPGITRLEDFEKDQTVTIIDETHGKPLAIGKALYSSAEMRTMDSGNVIQSLHHIGDELWSQNST